jgi:hypothetical protein
VIALRKITDNAAIRLWRNHFANQQQTNPLASWALASFVPSPSECDRISVFLIAENELPENIAAATSFVLNDIGPSFFIGCPVSLLKSKRITLVKSPGETHFPDVNPAHRDLMVATPNAVRAVTKAFWSQGTVHPVEKKSTQAALVRLARVGGIDFQAVANDKQRQHSRTRVMDLVADQHAIVKGVDQTA